MLKSTEVKLVFTFFRWVIIAFLLGLSSGFFLDGYFISAALTLITATIWTAYFREKIRHRWDFRTVASLRFVVTILLVLTAIVFSGYLEPGATEPLFLKTAQNFIP